MVKQLALLIMAAGCSAEELHPNRLPGCPPEPVAVDPAGARHGWVVDSVRLPDTATDANRLAINVDCDPENRPDNAMAGILAAIGQYESSDLNQTLAEMIGDGRLLHLLSIQATSPVTAEGVGITLLHGLDTDGDPTDNFLGGEAFAVDTTRGRGLLSGRLVNSRLGVSGGQLPIGMTMPGLDEVFILPVEASRIEAAIEGDRIEGRIAGVIRGDAVGTVLLPFIHRGLVRAIDRDCAGTATGAPPCDCAAGSFGETLIRYFDDLPDRAGVELDGDCVLGLDELRQNSLASSFLAPDVDLFDADGRFNPRSDGVKESLSLGIGFSAVPAQIP